MKSREGLPDRATGSVPETVRAQACAQVSVRAVPVCVKSREEWGPSVQRSACRDVRERSACRDMRESVSVQTNKDPRVKNMAVNFLPRSRK